jgi:hypothetical protein
MAQSQAAQGGIAVAAHPQQGTARHTMCQRLTEKVIFAPVFHDIR